MGGEKHSINTPLSIAAGSPPHGRGKGSQRKLPRRSPGITPAWAGKSRTGFYGITSNEDHPRMGGEKGFRTIIPFTTGGSPPHGRGKVSSVSMCTRSPGITPAWAGKRVPILWVIQLQWDHPRVGGEKSFTNIVIHLFPGSPPRGRGKVILLLSTRKASRITPAWAGKSGLPARARSWR